MLGSLFPLVGWLLYAVIVSRIERVRPSLSLIMSEHRRRWVANALSRDNPVDAILTSNLMGSISFFASTMVLLIIALFTVSSQFEAIGSVLGDLRFGPPPGPFELEVQLLSMLALLTAGFFSFTLSLRQFNHFCILLGAARHGTDDQSEIIAIAAINSIAARNFNQGIRAYYFFIAAVAWFWTPLASIAGTLIIAGILMMREFHSAARSLIAGLDVADADTTIKAAKFTGYRQAASSLRSAKAEKTGKKPPEDSTETP